MLRTDNDLINQLKKLGINERQCNYIRRVWSRTEHEEIWTLEFVLGFILLVVILIAYVFQTLEWPVEIARRLFWVYLLADVFTTTKETVAIHKMYTTPNLKIQNELLSRVNIERYVLSSQRTMWTLILLWVCMVVFLGIASLKTEMVVAFLGLISICSQFTISRMYILKRIDKI